MAPWEMSKRKQEPRADRSACPLLLALQQNEVWILPFPPTLGQLRAHPAWLWAAGFTLTLSVLGFFYSSRACLGLGVVTIDNLPPRALILLRVGGDT